MIQIPTDVPNPDNNSPIDITNTVDILLFIVAPIILIILYFVLRRKSKAKSTDENEND